MRKMNARKVLSSLTAGPYLGRGGGGENGGEERLEFASQNNILSTQLADSLMDASRIFYRKEPYIFWWLF